MYYNPYEQFTENEKIEIIPFIKTKIKDSDKTYIWKKRSDRLDKISQKFYGHPYGSHLILTANSTLGANEDDFEDGVILIIPYPYRESLQLWVDAINRFKTLY